jgi:hypothetical protein
MIKHQAISNASSSNELVLIKLAMPTATQSVLEFSELEKAQFTIKVSLQRINDKIEVFQGKIMD